MRRLCVTLLLVGVGAPWGVAAHAQSQPFVAPTLGTVLYTNTTSYYEIDSVEGSTVRSVGNRLAYSPWIVGCRNLGSTVDFDMAGADALWPLEIGKTAISETRRNEFRWAINLRVKGREKVTVPAGTFDAWIIELEETAATHDYKVSFDCWYAPDVGFAVKRRHRILVGRTASPDFDIVRIERKDRSRTSPFRSPPPGTSFDTTLGTYRIDGAEGTNLLRRSDEANLNTTWVGGLVGFSSADNILEAAKQDFSRLWPLEIGKTIRFDINRRDGGVWNNVFTVERMETVKVPAGTFSAFVISQQERAINGSYSAAYTYWWSPALGFPIKRDVRFVTGSSAPSSYELRRVVAPPS
jgi:hypothetical protein